MTGGFRAFWLLINIYHIILGSRVLRRVRGVFTSAHHTQYSDFRVQGSGFRVWGRGFGFVCALQASRSAVSFGCGVWSLRETLESVGFNLLC